MKRVLMTATVASTIGQFNMNNISVLQEMGYEVYVGCNFQDKSIWTEKRIEAFKKELNENRVLYYQVDFPRNPFALSKEFKAYKQLKKIIQENKIELIHCHTPVAGVISRIVAHFESIKVIYTAHGFHFYSGAPMINWILYYSIEKFLAKWTDVLITINKEDYYRAKHRFISRKVEYVPGIGINIRKFQAKNVCFGSVRKELGVLDNDIFLLSVGELSKRKNHEIIIKIIKQINNPKIKYFICGQGELRAELEKLIKRLNLQNNVILLGYRTDICELCKTADLFVFPSLQEGLPVALMEAIACGTFVVCSMIRGNIDLIEEESCLFDPKNYNSAFKIISNNIKRIKNKEDARIVQNIIYNNYKKIQNYDESIVKKRMIDIYSNC